MSCGLLLKSLPVCLLGVITFGLMIPIWSSRNTVRIRSHLPKGRYGEFNGLIRVPRAALTLAGATTIAWSLDANLYVYPVVALPLLMLVPIALNLKLGQKNDN